MWLALVGFTAGTGGIAWLGSRLHGKGTQGVRSGDDPAGGPAPSSAAAAEASSVQQRDRTSTASTSAGVGRGRLTVPAPVAAAAAVGAVLAVVLGTVWATSKRRGGTRSRRSAPGGPARIPLRELVRFREQQWFLEELENSREGDPNAMLRLAKMYLYGQGCERSVHLAQEWLRRARAGGVYCTLDELLTAEDLERITRKQSMAVQQPQQQGGASGHSGAASNTAMTVRAPGMGYESGRERGMHSSRREGLMCLRPSGVRDRSGAVAA